MSVNSYSRSKREREQREWEDKQNEAQRDKIERFADVVRPREDWHEPDEQDIVATITGTHLDNAFGEHQDVLPTESQEYVVTLTSGEASIKLNLANLLADYVRLIRGSRER